MMYLEDREYSVQEISQVEKVSDKTVYKDLGIACGIVAVYLLGIWFERSLRPYKVQVEKE